MTCTQLRFLQAWFCCMNSEECGLKEEKRENAHFYEEMRRSGRSTTIKTGICGKEPRTDWRTRCGGKKGTLAYWWGGPGGVEGDKNVTCHDVSISCIILSGIWWRHDNETGNGSGKEKWTEQIGPQKETSSSTSEIKNILLIHKEKL